MAAEREDIRLRSRLLVAVTMWKEAVRGEPLPRLPPGDPADQLRDFELRLVDALCAQATPSSAAEMADRTWDLVHDRPDDDAVKRRVVECHERLAQLRR